MVIFGADIKAIKELARQDKIEPNVIVGIKSGVKSKIQEKNGMYLYLMKIKRKRTNDMEVDAVQKDKGEDGDTSEEENFSEGEQEFGQREFRSCKTEASTWRTSQRKR